MQCFLEITSCFDLVHMDISSTSINYVCIIVEAKVRYYIFRLFPMFHNKKQ